MFERLFKYPWSLYRVGEVQLAWPWTAWLAASLALLLAAWWFAGSRDARSRLARRERLGMALLRAALLAMMLLLLLRPVLLVPMAATERADLLVLVDESMSMTIADADGIARATHAEAVLRATDGGLLDRLASRFRIRQFAYAAGLRRLGDDEWPRFDVARSDLAGALSALAAGTARGRPAAVLLVGDGGMDDDGLHAALLGFRAAGLPVHVLGAGDAHFAPDAELANLRVPARVYAGDSVEAEITVLATGMAGRRARLTLSVDGDERVHTDVDLPADGRHLRVRLPLDMKNAGLARVAASLASSPGERLDANNDASALVEVLSRAAPVLHYEGEPRFEVKFLRRALNDDEALSLVSLVRTADNKFYRLGVGSDDELAEGFPHDAAGLFGFSVVVLGARAAAALDPDTQTLLEQFVARRGGALVLLEGARRGARPGALIERLSPLPPPVAEETPAVVRVRASPETARHPLTGFLLAGGESSQPLDALPALTLARRVRSAKPGATTLLLGDDGGADALVVLAVHRYGRGRVVALPVRDSWRWQMHATVGPHDQTHQKFWRQMLRWLAREVPARVELHTSAAVAVPGVEVEVQVTLRDTAWQALTAAPPRLRLTTPLGDQFDLDTQPSPTPGLYSGRFVPGVAGLWEMRLQDDTGGDADEPVTGWLEVRARGREFHRPALDEALLRDVAHTTGGSYRPLARSDELLDLLQPVRATQGRLQGLPLWDVPALYLLLLLLACAEWAWRRSRRLP